MPAVLVLAFVRISKNCLALCLALILHIVCRSRFSPAPGEV